MSLIAFILEENEMKTIRSIVDISSALLAGLILTIAAILLLVLVALNAHAWLWGGATEISVWSIVTIVVLLPIGIIMLIHNPRRGIALIIPFAWWMAAPFVMPGNTSATVDQFASLAAVNAYAMLPSIKNVDQYCSQAKALSDALYKTPISDVYGNGGRVRQAQLNARWTVNETIAGAGVLPEATASLEYVIRKGESNGCGMTRAYWHGAEVMLKENANKNQVAVEQGKGFIEALRLNVPGVLRSVFYS